MTAMSDELKSQIRSMAVKLSEEIMHDKGFYANQREFVQTLTRLDCFVTEIIQVLDSH